MLEFMYSCCRRLPARTGDNRPKRRENSLELGLNLNVLHTHLSSPTPFCNEKMIHAVLICPERAPSVFLAFTYIHPSM